MPLEYGIRRNMEFPFNTEFWKIWNSVKEFRPIWISTTIVWVKERVSTILVILQSAVILIGQVSDAEITIKSEVKNPDQRYLSHI